MFYYLVEFKILEVNKMVIVKIIKNNLKNFF